MALMRCCLVLVVVLRLTVYAWSQDAADSAVTASVDTTIIIDERLVQAAIHFDDGNKFFQQEDWPAAIDQYRKSLSYNDQNPKTNYNLGVALLNAGDYSGALLSLDNALNLNPEYADAYAMKGNALYRSGRSDEALQMFENALTADPTCAKAYLGLGTVYLETNRNEQAAEALRRSIKLDAKCQPAYTSLAETLINLNQFDGAIDAADEAIALSSKDWNPYYLKALAANKTNRSKDALEAARLCLKFRPNYIPALFEMGIAYETLGQKNKASDHFKKCLADKTWRPGAEYHLKLLKKK